VIDEMTFMLIAPKRYHFLSQCNKTFVR